MQESDLLDLIDPLLRGLGAAVEEGERCDHPRLDVLRTAHRPVRLGAFPLLNRGRSVVAVVRQPVDLSLVGGYRTLLSRVGTLVDSRFPPFGRQGAFSIGLTTLVLTPEPIAAEDDAALDSCLGRLPRLRSWALGLFRINLGQEAFAFALRRGPDGLFPEPERLADALSERLRRFVPQFDDRN